MYGQGCHYANFIRLYWEAQSTYNNSSDISMFSVKAAWDVWWEVSNESKNDSGPVINFFYQIKKIFLACWAKLMFIEFSLKTFTR